MSYCYETQKKFIFTDEGQRKFLHLRDFTERALEMSGAVQAGHILAVAGSGDSWDQMSCIDRLVELGELREIPNPSCAWQHRVFVQGRAK